MRLYINLNTFAVTLDPFAGSHIASALYAKRGDASTLDLQFHRDGTPELLASPLLEFILKDYLNFDGAAIVDCTSFSTPSSASGFYSGAPNYAGSALSDRLIDGVVNTSVANQAARYALTGKTVGTIVRQNDDTSYWIVIDAGNLSNSAGWSSDCPNLASVTLGAEITWSQSPSFSQNSSQSFTVQVANDYKKGGETAPGTVVPFGTAFLQNRCDLTAFTGGTSTTLDGMAITSADIGRAFAVLAASEGVMSVWLVYAGTDAQNVSGGVVRPTNFDGSLNAVVFKRIA